MTEVKVNRIRPSREADDSHVVELSDGSTAVIPAALVSLVVQTLQGGLTQRVFAQSQQFSRPTESNLALPEFHLRDARAATLGRMTNLACNLSELGWVAFLSEDEALRQMKEAIEKVLIERSASSRTN